MPPSDDDIELDDAYTELELGAVGLGWLSGGNPPVDPIRPPSKPPGDFVG
jgi:hypothetical protein